MSTHVTNLAIALQRLADANIKSAQSWQVEFAKVLVAAVQDVNTPLTDSIESKISTFFQPDPPSEDGRTTGDLWFDTDDNFKLYRFDASQPAGHRWVHVDIAQLDLTAIIEQLAAMSLDSRLTMGEKTSLTPVMQGLLLEHNDLITMAAGFDPAQISTAAYEGRFQAFVTYMRAPIPALDTEADSTYTVNGLGFPGALQHSISPHSYTEPSSSDYTAWMAVGNISSLAGTIAINGATFRSVLGDVLDERQILVNAMTDRNRIDVDKAMADLNRISADGWLSSPEKRSTWVDFRQLIDEQGGLTQQANTQGGVSVPNTFATELANYTLAITRLQNYMAAPQPANPPSTGGAHNDVSPDSPTNGLNMGRAQDGTGTGTYTPTDNQVSAWMAYDTAIDPATFRERFSRAYSTRAILLAAMQQNSWSTAKDARDRIISFTSDNVISKAEKPSLFREYMALMLARAGLLAQATARTELAASCAVAIAEYKQRLWELQNFMFHVMVCPPDTVSETDASPWDIRIPTTDDLTTWIASTSTGDTVFTDVSSRNAFVNAWLNAYIARDALLAQIASSAAGYALDASTQMAILNGAIALKNSVLYQGTLPTEDGHVTGDIWYDTSDMYRIYKFDSTQVVGHKWVSFGYVRIDASQMTTGQLGADQIAANSVAINKLIVGNFDNLCPNPSSEVVIPGTPGPDSVLVTEVGSDARGGTKVRQLIADSTGYAAAYIAGSLCSGQDGRLGARIPCGAGDQFYAEVYAKLKSGTGGNARINCRFHHDALTADGWGSVKQFAAADGQWNPTSMTGMAPKYDPAHPELPLTTEVSFYIEIAGYSPGAVVYFDSFYIRRMADGSIVVDGGIQARNIGADAIQTSNYQPNDVNDVGTDNEYALHGAKMRRTTGLLSTSPSLLVDPAGFRIGTKIVSEAWFSRAESYFATVVRNMSASLGQTFTDGFVTGVSIVAGSYPYGGINVVRLTHEALPAGWNHKTVITMEPISDPSEDWGTGATPCWTIGAAPVAESTNTTDIGFYQYGARLNSSNGAFLGYGPAVKVSADTIFWKINVQFFRWAGGNTIYGV